MLQCTQYINRYVVNRYHGKYVTQQYTKVHSITQRLFKIEIRTQLITTAVNTLRSSKQRYSAAHISYYLLLYRDHILVSSPYKREGKYKQITVKGSFKYCTGRILLICVIREFLSEVASNFKQLVFILFNYKLTRPCVKTYFKTFDMPCLYLQ